MISLIPYVLIIVTSAGGVATQEFGSKQACESAKQTIIQVAPKHTSDSIGIILCVDKYELDKVRDK